MNIDITVYLDGYHGDCSEMFVIGGNPDPESKALLQATYDCWIKACQFVKPGRDYKELGAIIEDHVVPLGLSTVRNFCGHGIGSVFHTTPNILHYRNNEPNGQMAAGHTFTIEPMICVNSANVLNWPDIVRTACFSSGFRATDFCTAESSPQRENKRMLNEIKIGLIKIFIVVKIWFVYINLKQSYTIICQCIVKNFVALSTECIKLLATFVFLQWCLSEAASCPRGETLNEDKTLNQLVTAPLQKHTVVGCRAYSTLF